MTDSDQSLAAEPGFHGKPPQRGGSGVSAIRRFSNYRSDLMEQQPENGLALASGPAPALGVVMEAGAGGAALEAGWMQSRRWPRAGPCRRSLRTATNNYALKSSLLLGFLESVPAVLAKLKAAGPGWPEV